MVIEYSRCVLMDFSIVWIALLLIWILSLWVIC